MLETSRSWSEAVQLLSERNEDYVLITVLGVKGSAPRDSGTKMVVTKNATYATIGGGHLEYKSTLIARDLLGGSAQDQHIEHFALGASLGQCCGGSVSVLFEKFIASKINIMLFGAGHVGQALATILGQLPCHVTWVDSREGFFPDALSEGMSEGKLEGKLEGKSGAISKNIKTVVSEYPAEEIESMPEGSYFIVMTHNHQIDLEICASILQGKPFEYLGLIGSESKWRRFQSKLKQRLSHAQLPENSINKIACPIGLSEVKGKMPMEVAVSIAGEIISHYQSNKQIEQQSKSHHFQGVTWPELKSISENLLVQE